MTLFQVYEFAFACCSVAAVALLIWDHVITFGQEVRRIWSPKLSGGTVLFAFLRYGTLVEKIAILLLASWYMTPNGCNVAVRFQIFPMILRTLGFGLFSSLRVYALMRSDWRLASFVFLLCLPAAITPAYVYAHQYAQGVSRYGCQLAYVASQTVHQRIRIAGIVSDILSETIVIFVTLHRTLGLVKATEATADSEKKERPGLHQLLLKDGSIYFAALLVLSLADMLVLIFDHVPQSVIGYDYWVVPYYTPVFRTIIICRFMLNLRSIYTQQADGSDKTVVSSVGSLHFADRVVGTMGAPVSMGHGHVESWEDCGDDVIYSEDPLAEGMLTRSQSTITARMAPGEKGKGKEVDNSTLHSRGNSV